MDLTEPDLRFDKMAEAMGVPGIRVEQPADLAGALREAVGRTDGPRWWTCPLRGPSASATLVFMAGHDVSLPPASPVCPRTPARAVVLRWERRSPLRETGGGCPTQIPHLETIR